MAEIKSAIELAMERTKGLRLSQGEKEKLKEEEIQSKAHGLDEPIFRGRFSSPGSGEGT